MPSFVLLNQNTTVILRHLDLMVTPSMVVILATNGLPVK